MNNEIKNDWERPCKHCGQNIDYSAKQRRRNGINAKGKIIESCSECKIRENLKIQMENKIQIEKSKIQIEKSKKLYRKKCEEEQLKYIFQKIFPSPWSRPEHLSYIFSSASDIEKTIMGNGEILISDNYFFCPLCKTVELKSDYLEIQFSKDSKTEWLANMITHLRHHHTQYYDNGVGYMSAYRGEYEEFKNLVNERQKRNLIRKAFPFLIKNKISIEHFKNLKGTEEKTLELYEKKATKIVK